jgi:hypothetical protein
MEDKIPEKHYFNGMFFETAQEFLKACYGDDQYFKQWGNPPLNPPESKQKEEQNETKQ